MALPFDPPQKTLGEERLCPTEEIGTKCPDCGAENPEGKKFCGDCGGATRKEMTKIGSFNRAIVILASGVIPVGFGVLIGLFYTLRPDRKNDYLGPLCIILGFANSAIVWYITSLM